MVVLKGARKTVSVGDPTGVLRVGVQRHIGGRERPPPWIVNEDCLLHTGTTPLRRSRYHSVTHSEPERSLTEASERKDPTSTPTGPTVGRTSTEESGRQSCPYLDGCRTHSNFRQEGVYSGAYSCTGPTVRN